MMNWPKHKVTWTGTKDKGWNEELEKEVFPTSETVGRKRTSLGCSDFWDRNGGQALVQR